jgi:hypothetical protein
MPDTATVVTSSEADAVFARNISPSVGPWVPHVEQGT